MTHRRTTRPDAHSARFSELDALLLEYVREPAASTPTRRPPSRHRAEAVDPQSSRWSFERAAVRNSLRRFHSDPWFTKKDDKDQVA